MRYFPSAARQRATASVVGVVSLAALAIPLAQADDDLKHRQDQVKGQQNKVESQIDRAAQHLEEASRDAARASRQYAAARGRLGDARTALARATDRLVAARERDAELKQQLVEAEAALTVATDALVEGREDVRHQQAMVRNSVLSIYTQGDPRLRAVGALLSNASLEDLTRRQVADDMIVGRGVQAYDHLSDVKERLADRQDRVKLAAEAVEARRVEAAAHLETMRDIYDETRTAKLRVDKQADFKRYAQQRAIRAKVRDREVLRKLKQREAAIRQRLVRLAELARQRARKRGTGFTGASDGYLAYPARGSVTSPYGYRTHPIYGYYSLHNGTDFGVGCGQSLYASATGTVIDTYYDSVYGNRLYLNVGVVNGNSLVLVYNHLSGYNAREGQRVSRGQVIGYAGTTGWSTGCHLHFTVLENGNPVDPMKYL